MTDSRPMRPFSFSRHPSRVDRSLPAEPKSEAFSICRSSGLMESMFSVSLTACLSMASSRSLLAKRALSKVSSTFSFSTLACMTSAASFSM